MPHLILMRHAKSSWDTPALTDRERPLNARGNSDAPRMAAWLLARRIVPDTVATSDAVRAIETWEGMAPAIPNARAHVIPELYHASPSVILDAIRDTGDEARVLLLIGHEPGISAALHILAMEPYTPKCRASLESFPTAAMAVLKVDGPWSQIAPRALPFLDFIRPRELKAERASATP